MLDPEVRHNYITNVLDGAFFGFAIGFASFTTVIPLFVSTMTGSALLIGLIPAIHNTGWQLPQLLTARHVSRLKRFKPTVMLMTVHERLPFLGLAAIAWFVHGTNQTLALILTFLMLVWQGLGAGFTANAWQNMIAHVIPKDYRATFFGVQSGASNLLASLGALLAGLILEAYSVATGFALCFLLATLWMAFSFGFIGRTRESDRSDGEIGHLELPFWDKVRAILKSDRNFRWFLASRMLSQFGFMSFAFYTVYAVTRLGMNEAQAGVLTSVLLLTQVIANPVLGRLADRWSRRAMLELGAIMGLLSALVAWWAASVSWFYAVIVLAGIANTSYWTIGLAITLEFGREEERPTYVGLANTLVVPSTIVAPLFGGWLADLMGYQTTFLAAAILSLGTIVILHYLVRDPEVAVELETVRL